MMDRLLGRNPAARNADTLGQTDAEKAAIEKQQGGKERAALRRDGYHFPRCPR